MTNDPLLAQLEPLGDNRTNLPRLREQLAKPLGVIPFVGAGLSIPYGFKGWGAFLLDQAGKAGIAREIQARLDAGEFEEAGEEVLHARAGRAFENAIEAEYGNARFTGDPGTGAAAVLPRMAPGPVITTNFDHVLERVFDHAGKKFQREVWGAQATSAHAALTQDRHFLLKLHGDVDEQTDRVLTRSDYARYYGAPDSLLCQILRRLFAARPLLFLGCSLAQDRWVQLLGEVTRADPSLEHYAIVEYPATETEYYSRQRFLSQHGITPIWFPHAHFECIEPLLKSLAPLSSVPISVNPPGGTILTKRNRLVGGPDDPLLAHTTGFFGRTPVVETVLQFLRGREDMATVTPEVYSVKGAPGIGKSEICKEALQQYLRAAPESRVYYVELADTRDQAGLVTRLADAFDVPRANTSVEVLAAIAQHACLVYLDNLEDILGDPRAVDTLAQLVALPAVRVLASSRAHLPRLARDIPVRELDLDAAVKLFVSEWNKSAPDRPLDDSPKLRTFLNRELEGHALAIVLLAAQAYQVVSLDELCTRWRNEKTRMAELPHAGDRLSSLDISLARSLVAAQSECGAAVTLWGLCGLFPDGVSPAAFDAVTAAFAAVKYTAREVLLRLNIVRVENEGLQMLAPLRQFILATADRSEAGLTTDALLDATFPYHALVATGAQQTELDATGAARGPALDSLLREFPNLSEFILTAAQRGTSWAEPLGKLSRTLQNSYQFRGLISIEILRTILRLEQQASRVVNVAHSLEYLGDLENRLGEIDAARGHYAEAIGLYKQERDNLGLANALKSVGDLENRLGEIDAARGHYAEAIGLYKQERDNLGLANALISVGDLEKRLGEIDAARGHYAEAIGLYKQERANLGLANALKSVGDLENRLGEIDAARGHYAEAIGLYKQERANLGLANALKSVGDLENRLGEIDAARGHYAEAIGLYKQERANLGLANALISVGDLEKRLGEIDAARGHYAEAIGLYKQERANLGLANALKSVGDLENRLGEIDAARGHYAEAIGLYKQERANLGLANALKSVGDLENRLGEIDAARGHYAEAIGLYKQERDNLGLANALKSVGDLENRLGEIDAARGHYAEAIGLYKQERANLGLANALISVGDLENRLGEIDAARGHYAEAIGLYKQERANLGLANALISVGDLENRLGEIDAARGHYAEAIGLYKQERDNLGLANALKSVGDLEKRLGEIDAARGHYAEAIGLYKQERDNLGLANALQSLGDLELALKHHHEANTHYAKARELYLAERDAAGLGYTDAELARVASALGQMAQADQYLQEGMRAAQVSGILHVAQYVAQAAAEIHPELAQRALDPAAIEAELRKQTQDDSRVADEFGAIAYQLRTADRFQEAEPFYRRALELDGHNPRRYGGLVLLLRQTGRDAEALPIAEAWFALVPGDPDPPLALAALNRKTDRESETARYLDVARRLVKADAWYARACLESIAGNVDAAIENLRQAATDKGFDAHWAGCDPDLEWIRDDPRFKQIVGEESSDEA